jgi:N-acetylglucosaminyldiphosphoundecaprenol N-acetyl-beta-D-mannosaminyltransferase
MAGRLDVPRVDILGVGVTALNLDGALRAIEGWIERGTRTYVCVTPVAGVMACQRDPELRRIFNASGMTTPDGMPIVWFLRLLGHRSVGRVYGPDLMRAVCRRSESAGWRHHFYGGLPSVAARLAARLETEHRGLSVVGFGTPPIPWQPGREDREGVETINASGADIVWVGLSTPKQEQWMAIHRSRLQAPVLIGVGAAFDFLSGVKPQAPRWMQRSGLEWLFRLAAEPRRLWRRYLVDNPLFVILVTLQLLGLRRSEGRKAEKER